VCAAPLCPSFDTAIEKSLCFILQGVTVDYLSTPERLPNAGCQGPRTPLVQTNGGAVSLGVRERRQTFHWVRYVPFIRTRRGSRVPKTMAFAAPAAEAGSAGPDQLLLAAASDAKLVTWANRNPVSCMKVGNLAKPKSCHLVETWSLGQTESCESWLPGQTAILLVA